MTCLRSRASWNHPLREGKGTLYEGGLRIPTIVRWPGTIEGGRISEELIISTDIYPTVAELAGITVDHKIEGLSLLPHMLRSELLDRETLYWHYPHYHIGMPGGVIREGDFKLIEYFETGELELYNLREDLQESHNLAGEFPEIAKELQIKLNRWREENGAKMPIPNTGYIPESR
ncbi:MAG: sulfatase-like hydrolase/transferase [Bacteroidota bacterium]|nr:sulfatase-like hydrolase/transferase [Bacteroidota bacterium]